MSEKKLATVEKRIIRNKSRLLDQLKTVPVIQVACEKTGIGRSTYYRWRKQDKEFAKKADKALREGVQFINDMAESQLISSIKDKHMTAIIYWLKHRHPAFSTRIELAHQVDAGEINLTLEQKQLIQKAINIVLPNKNGSEKD